MGSHYKTSIKSAPLRSSILTIFLGITLISWHSCAQDRTEELGNMPAMITENTIRCVIEIPAGTNKKIEYSDTDNDFQIDIRDGQERTISFLPYPANYGFIPSTRSNALEGGDGDHLDAIVLCESLSTGTVVEARPIAVLKLIDNDEEDYKIVCVPTAEEMQILHARTLEELQQKYPGVIDILTIWFSKYDQADELRLEGLGDEEESLELIKNAIISTNAVQN